MNCKEAQSYIEEAIDGCLEGSRKRKVDAHLSRCAGCRERFAAEKAEPYSQMKSSHGRF